MPVPDDLRLQQEQEEQAALVAQQREYIARRNREDLDAILGSPSGRRFLYQLMREFNFYNDIAVGPGSDFQLGIRRAAMFLREKVSKIDPTLPARMELEWLQLDEPTTPRR